jgi:hypothetical protein
VHLEIVGALFLKPAIISHQLPDDTRFYLQSKAKAFDRVIASDKNVASNAPALYALYNSARVFQHCMLALEKAHPSKDYSSAELPYLAETLVNSPDATAPNVVRFDAPKPQSGDKELLASEMSFNVFSSATLRIHCFALSIAIIR